LTHIHGCDRDRFTSVMNFFLIEHLFVLHVDPELVGYLLPVRITRTPGSLSASLVSMWMIAHASVSRVSGEISDDLSLPKSSLSKSCSNSSNDGGARREGSGEGQIVQCTKSAAEVTTPTPKQ